MKRIAGIAIVATAAAGPCGASLAKAVNVDDKYSLKSPSGIAFSDFRGYEDWAVVGPARTTEVLKIIVANPAMIKAYKAGTPGNGQPFPEGSRIVKLQWKPKKSTEAPFDVDVADTPGPGLRHGKGHQEISEERRRVGIRCVQLRRPVR